MSRFSIERARLPIMRDEVDDLVEAWARQRTEAAARPGPLPVVQPLPAVRPSAPALTSLVTVANAASSFAVQPLTVPTSPVGGGPATDVKEPRHALAVGDPHMH